MTQPIILMKGIVKEFNHTRVLDNVNFELQEGEIHALLGENGAGKSTLMKILRGVYQPEDGEIVVKGKSVKLGSALDSRANGISMVFQEFSLIGALTVAQNIYLTREVRNRVGLIDDRKVSEKALSILKQMGVEIDPNIRVEELSTGYRQLTEIASALSQDASVLILDEPTASLSRTETDSLFEILRKLKQNGISIIYISHRMEEIFQIADRITILRDGKNIITESTKNLNIEKVIEHILGHTASEEILASNKEYRSDEIPVLEVKHLKCENGLQDANLRLFAGEVLGIAGLMGSGRTELVETLFGITPAMGGEVIINGKPVRVKGAKNGMYQGIAFIPEDRRLQGLIGIHSIKANFELPLIILRRLVKHNIFVNDQNSIKLTNSYVEKLRIRTDSINKEAQLLSGGNQQKIVISKWLSTLPEILIMDEPTAGVDIGTKTEILEIARELANQGKAVLIISSELQELLKVCDRILLIKKGEISVELPRMKFQSEEKLHQILQGA